TLHTFPTRRSSDLVQDPAEQAKQNTVNCQLPAVYSLWGSVFQLGSIPPPASRPVHASLNSFSMQVVQALACNSLFRRGKANLESDDEEPFQLPRGFSPGPLTVGRRFAHGSARGRPGW